MADAHKNFAYSLVATAPAPADTGTSLVVTATEGANFPTPPFNVTIWPTAVQPLKSNAEVATVTGVSGDTLTIIRAQEGSSARTVVVGDQIAATITDKSLTDTEGDRETQINRAIQPGYSQVIPKKMQIPSGNKYAIGIRGCLRIL